MRPSRRHAAAFLCLAMSSLVATPAFATSNRVHPGVDVGAAGSNFSGELHDLANTKARTRLTVGAHVRFDLDSRLSLQPEVRYVPKGAEVTSAITDVDGNVLGHLVSTYKLDYLELPVLIRASVPLEGPVSPFLYFAPTPTFAIERRYDLGNSSYYPPGFPTTVDLKNEVRGFEFAGAVGGGVDWRAGPGILTLDVRYEVGLEPFFTAAGAANDKNRTVAVTLGYGY